MELQLGEHAWAICTFAGVMPAMVPAIAASTASSTVAPGGSVGNLVGGGDGDLLGEVVGAGDVGLGVQSVVVNVHDTSLEKLPFFIVMVYVPVVATLIVADRCFGPLLMEYDVPRMLKLCPFQPSPYESRMFNVAGPAHIFTLLLYPPPPPLYVANLRACSTAARANVSRVC